MERYMDDPASPDSEVFLWMMTATPRQWEKVKDMSTTLAACCKPDFAQKAVARCQQEATKSLVKGVKH